MIRCHTSNVIVEEKWKLGWAKSPRLICMVMGHKSNNFYSCIGMNGSIQSYISYHTILYNNVCYETIGSHIQIEGKGSNSIDNPISEPSFKSYSQYKKNHTSYCMFEVRLKVQIYMIEILLIIFYLNFMHI